MKPPPFLYSRPATLAEAVDLLVDHGDEAKVLAGGQSLVPLLNLRLARPGLLVDIGFVSGLDGVVVGDDHVSVGAMARQRTIEESAEVRVACPLLGAALAHVGHTQTRNQGTIGGSVAHADPAAELPALVLALNAEMVVTGPLGVRVVPAGAFFTGPFTTSMGPAEILTEIRFPVTGTRPVAFAEMARRSGDFAIAGVAAVTHLDGIRLAACGVSWAPLRLEAAERALLGRELSSVSIGEAAAAARKEVDPADDVHGDAEYRRELVEVLVTRTLEEVAA